MDMVKLGAFNLPPRLRTRECALWQMAKVAHAGCEQSFHLLQESIHHLNDKAQKSQPFSGAERVFLQTLLTCPWWGGKEYGANESKRFTDPEAQSTSSISGNATQHNITDPAQISLAHMAQHYVHGKGQYYAASLPIYRDSIVVNDTVAALRAYIRELYTFKKPATLVATTDRGFLHSVHAKEVEKKRQLSQVQGYIFSDGSLMLEQKDPRILNVGNRFRITAMTSSMGVQLMTRWRIEGTYRFETFANGDVNTGLPLTDELVLQVPSRLADHMVALGIAKPFRYFADWAEHYPLINM